MKRNSQIIRITFSVRSFFIINQRLKNRGRCLLVFYRLSSICSQYFVQSFAIFKSVFLFSFQVLLFNKLGRNFCFSSSYNNWNNFPPSFPQYKYAWFNSFSNLSIFNALFIFLINIFIHYGYIEIFFIYREKMGRLKISRT